MTGVTAPTPAAGDDGAVFDVVVIGGGTAGIVAAQSVAASGRRALLVEESRLGGECTWNGCVPSKALIEAARLVHQTRRAGRFGVRVEPAVVDFPAVMGHVRDRIQAIAAFEDAAHLAGSGVEVRIGRARLGPGPRLFVDEEPVATRRVLICSGSRPATPPIPGLADCPFLTNETLFDLDRQPERLIVLGAGAVGLEMAQAFARLGTSVEVLDVVASLLPREDPDIARAAFGILEREGVGLRLGSDIQAVRYGDGGYEVEYLRSGERKVIAGDALLVATGRRPNIDGLGLEAAGVEARRSGVVVDDHLRTTAPGVFAAGDVTGILPFTHVAAYQGRLAARNALGKRQRADYRVVPWVIFTDPEIAHVGLTEPEARSGHSPIRTAVLPFSAVDRAVIQRDAQGLVKVITGSKPALGFAGGGDLLGAHLIGPGAGDLIHEFALAMRLHAFSGRLAQTIHAYPTMALGVQQAVARLFEGGRQTAGGDRAELAELG